MHTPLLSVLGFRRLAVRFDRRVLARRPAVSLDGESTRILGVPFGGAEVVAKLLDAFQSCCKVVSIRRHKRVCAYSDQKDRGFP